MGHRGEGRGEISDSGNPFTHTTRYTQNVQCMCNCLNCKEALSLSLSYTYLVFHQHVCDLRPGVGGACSIGEST